MGAFPGGTGEAGQCAACGEEFGDAVALRAYGYEGNHAHRFDVRPTAGRQVAARLGAPLPTSGLTAEYAGVDGLELADLIRLERAFYGASRVGDRP